MRKRKYAVSERAAALLLVLFGLFASAAAADWKPARAPLMTRWAKDVTPDDVLPDYPRPQMRRARWLALNGLWQFAVAADGEPPPFGRELSGQILVPF